MKKCLNLGWPLAVMFFMLCADARGAIIVTPVDFTSAALGDISGGGYSVSPFQFSSSAPGALIVNTPDAMTGQYLALNDGGIVLTISNSTAFTLSSLDWTDFGTSGTSLTVGATSYFGGGTITPGLLSTLIAPGVFGVTLTSNDAAGIDSIYLSRNVASAVPEPGSLAILGFGAIGMFFRNRRRNRAALIA